MNFQNYTSKSMGFGSYVPREREWESNNYSKEKQKIPTVFSSGPKIMSKLIAFLKIFYQNCLPKMKELQIILLLFFYK